jgi:hypothetical protein
LKHSTEQNTALEERINTLLFSPKKIFSSWSNVESSSKADLFLFPEWHANKEYRKTMNRYINEHYREGDIVLVEGIPAGTAERNQQVEYLKEGIPVYGWEPQNFKELIAGSSVQKLQEMLKEMKAFPSKFMPMAYDFEAIGSHLDVVISEFQKLAAYFDPKMPPAKIEAEIKRCYEGSKTKDNPREVFQVVIVLLLKKLEDKQEKAFLDHETPDEIEKVIKNVRQRNLSLVTEIQRYHAQGKRVFVIAGAAHFLHWPFSVSSSALKEIHACLREHKFVMCAEKNMRTSLVMLFNRQFFSHLKKVEP